MMAVLQHYFPCPALRANASLSLHTQKTFQSIFGGLFYLATALVLWNAYLLLHKHENLHHKVLELDLVDQFWRLRMDEKKARKCICQPRVEFSFLFF